jgi:hypothetical protein
MRYTLVSNLVGKTMDKPIRVPRNLTALMQHLQRLVTSGHYFWTSDRIPVGKLTGFINKWQPRFQLRADAAARSYRKRVGRASVHLCLHPDALAATQQATDWWMLSSPGKDGLQASGQAPGQVHDCRTLEGRLRYQDYELLEQAKSFTDAAGKVKTVTTWTWRIVPARYREWEALLVERAKVRDMTGITHIFGCLQAMPMFAGIRAQVMRLAAETNKVLGKVVGQAYELPGLPVMRMVRLWNDDAEV